MVGSHGRLDLCLSDQRTTALWLRCTSSTITATPEITRSAGILPVHPQTVLCPPSHTSHWRFSSTQHALAQRALPVDVSAAARHALGNAATERRGVVCSRAVAGPGCRASARRRHHPDDASGQVPCRPRATCSTVGSAVAQHRGAVCSGAVARAGSPRSARASAQRRCYPEGAGREVPCRPRAACGPSGRATGESGDPHPGPPPWPHCARAKGGAQAAVLLVLLQRGGDAHADLPRRKGQRAEAEGDKHP